MTRVVASYIAGTATLTFDDTVVTVEEIVERYNRANLRVMGRPEMIQ